MERSTRLSCGAAARMACRTGKENLPSVRSSARPFESVYDAEQRLE